MHGTQSVPFHPSPAGHSVIDIVVIIICSVESAFWVGVTASVVVRNHGLQNKYNSITSEKWVLRKSKDPFTLSESERESENFL